jgi:hypothetical protein
LALQVSEAEKGHERERRQVAREDKLAAARAEHETRVARALERAAAPVFKKSGKPVMFRSRPPQRKVSRGWLRRAFGYASSVDAVTSILPGSVGDDCAVELAIKLPLQHYCRR